MLQALTLVTLSDLCTTQAEPLVIQPEPTACQDKNENLLKIGNLTFTSDASARILESIGAGLERKPGSPRL